MLNGKNQMDGLNNIKIPKKSISYRKKSQDVSKLSLDFYKNAKKANKRCCSLY